MTMVWDFRIATLGGKSGHCWVPIPAASGFVPGARSQFPPGAQQNRNASVTVFSMAPAKNKSRGGGRQPVVCPPLAGAPRYALF